VAELLVTSGGAIKIPAVVLKRPDQVAVFHF